MRWLDTSLIKSPRTQPLSPGFSSLLILQRLETGSISDQEQSRLIMIIWWFWDWKEINNQLISTRKHEPIGSHSKHYNSPFELRATLLHHLPKLLPLSISSFISIYCFILFWHFSPKVPYHHSRNQWLLHMRRSHHNLQLEDLQISNPSIWNPSRSPPWIMGWIVAHSSGDV